MGGDREKWARWEGVSSLVKEVIALPFLLGLSDLLPIFGVVFGAEGDGLVYSVGSSRLTSNIHCRLHVW